MRLRLYKRFSTPETVLQYWQPAAPESECAGIDYSEHGVWVDVPLVIEPAPAVEPTTFERDGLVWMRTAAGDSVLAVGKHTPKYPNQRE